MKKNTFVKIRIALFAIILTALSTNSFSQVFWTEDFGIGTCANQGQLASAYAGAVGSWTVTVVGAEGADPNPWYVSTTEAGMGVGICGDGCLATAGLTNQTLHVGASVVTAGDAGAVYDAGGLCGVFACPQTNRRAESPLINATGMFNINLDFTYMTVGNQPLDQCMLEYSINSGATWTMLSILPVTPTCAGGQGLWTAFPSVVLPATCSNINTLKLGFHWVNNDDGTGTDPSFAVDDITLTVVNNTITTGTIAGSPFCACQTLNVPFTSSGTFLAGNIYTAELSDAIGSFAAPVSIGTLASTANAGSIPCTIPCAALAGSLYRIRVTSSSPICVGTPNTVDLTINPVLVPVVTASASANPICAGASVSFFAGPINGGTTPTYQWQVNGVNVGGATSATFVSTTIANGDNVTVIMTSNALCALPTTVTSTAIAMVVSPSVTPSVSITAVPSGPICAGTSVTFTATPTNGGTAPTFQWSINGVPVGGATSSTFTTTTLVNGDNVTVEMVSNANCVSPTTVTSPGIAIVVTTPVASVTITSTPTGTICTGDSVTFTATPTNGGATPTYQWQINGVDVIGATSAIFGTTGLVNGDNVTCIMTTSLTCATGSPATSNVITQVVSGAIVPSVTITIAPALPVCPGTPVTFTATPTNGGTTPTYQWLVNGVPFPGATNVTFTSSTLVTGDSVQVIMTSSSSCAVPTSGTSAAITMVVTAALPASVSILGVPASPICAGASVTFTATPTNGGTTPTYQWQINGTNVGGATSVTFTTTTLVNGDVIKVIMTSSSTCVSGSPATSTTLTYTVNPIPTVTVNSPSICAGATATLTASGATSYTWSAGATSTGVTTATATPATTTSYTVTGTSGTCSATAVATVTVTVCNSPVANFTVSDSVFCNSECVNFTDLSTNGPTSWSWSFPGGSPSSSTAQDPTNICYSVIGNYLVTLICSNATGADTLTKLAYINVVSPIPVTITGNTNVNACEVTELTAQPSGQSYSWGTFANGANISCNTCQTASVTATQTAIVYVDYTDVNGCPDSDTTVVNVTAKYSYFMPTGFSPNHDGNNDVLYVKGRGVSSIDLRIFDRNGEKVFTSTDLDNGWDGTYHGIPMNNNVFVYTLEVVFCNGDVQKEHGSVSLVK